MLKPPSNKISAETREKLLSLAEFIETNRTYGFWMQDIEGKAGLSDAPECDSACCIIGFSNAFYRRRDDNPGCADWLGIPQTEGNALFCPPAPHRQSNDRAKAVRVLRNFAYTGEVDWGV